MKKVLMLATTASMIEQFNKSNILLLEELGYEVHVAGNFEEGNPISEDRLDNFKCWLGEHHGKWFSIPATRQPFDVKNNIAAYRQVVQLISVNCYEFIHCHTPIGSVIGRLAAHKTKTKIIYTAHGFHFYKGAPLKNWLLYYPVERFLSRWTDVLVLINKEDFEWAKKAFHAKRTEYLPGVGIDLKRFETNDELRIQKRAELGLKTGDIMLFSVGELNDNKNHGIVIRAIANLNHPNIHYYVCGKGDLQESYEEMIRKFGVQDRVHIMGYQEDVVSFYQAADIFVLPSKREGLSVALMEAMASKKAVICSDIRGNRDLVEQHAGGIRVKPDDCVAYSDAIRYLMQEKEKCREYGQHNYHKISHFSLDVVSNKMEEIYRSIP